MSAPTVPPLYEQWHDGGFIVSEANGHQSRDQVTITGGVLVPAGTVLGKVTASGSFAPLNPAAADGSQTAAAILFGTRDATAGDRQGTVIDRNAEVNASELVWPTGITPAQITTATQQLAAVGVILR
ncbi:head decoration protein [Paraburkholderia mimosarum]|uniref:head decoration protein n=1 Tax=Paraburkholderia mimosarum TaxID=312026 RepID=UPI0003FE1372|nr:head decoration protein [Paraburkholderia mimosarum]